MDELRKLPSETEWVEFKRNSEKPEEIGEYLSALANSAALVGKSSAYIVCGIDDAPHDVVGTTFEPGKRKVGGEELENWLLRLLEPKIHFRFHPVEVDGRPLVLLEIGLAFRHPVRFQCREFIPVGSLQEEAQGLPGERTSPLADLRPDAVRGRDCRRAYEQRTCAEDARLSVNKAMASRYIREALGRE